MNTFKEKKKLEYRPGHDFKAQEITYEPKFRPQEESAPIDKYLYSQKDKEYKDKPASNYNNYEQKEYLKTRTPYSKNNTQNYDKFDLNEELQNQRNQKKYPIYDDSEYIRVDSGVNKSKQTNFRQKNEYRDNYQRDRPYAKEEPRDYRNEYHPNEYKVINKEQIYEPKRDNINYETQNNQAKGHQNKEYKTQEPYFEDRQNYNLQKNDNYSKAAPNQNTSYKKYEKQKNEQNKFEENEYLKNNRKNEKADQSIKFQKSKVDFNEKNEEKSQKIVSEKPAPVINNKSEKTSKISFLTNEMEDIWNQKRMVGEDQKKHVKFFNPEKWLNILMLAEKPSVALSISKTFDPKCDKNNSDSKGQIPIQNFQHTFFGHKANITCSSVVGHVYNRDFPAKYQNWNTVDPESLFSAETQKNEANESGKVSRHLTKLARGKDIVVFWLDNDREGENICFEILDLIYKELSPNPFRRIYRANFYSLVENEIRTVYNNLDSGPNLFLSLSVDARQIIDLKVGVAFTRFQSLFLKKKFVELKEKTISYGPCQTPTLAIVVTRDIEISKFEPKKYYSIVYKGKLDSSNQLENEAFKLTPLEGNNQFWNKEDAIKYRQSIQKNGTVVEIDTKIDYIVKPTALNTVSLQRFCCKNFNISSKEALDIAESLYLKKFTTYPRTESTSYPKGFNFKGVLQGLTSHSSKEIQNWSKELIAAGNFNPNKGVDKGDHPPIVPTENPPNANSLFGLESRVYEYISSNFLASISENATFEIRKIKFNFGGKMFTHSQKVLQKQGFLKYKKTAKIDEDYNSHQKFAKGDSILMNEMSVDEKFTQPPSKMNESELLKIMEQYNIGTDASMASHIDNIIKREYVKIEGDSRTLVSTALGTRLIEFYLQIDKELVEPQLRGNMEKRIESISLQQDKFEHVLDDMLSIFHSKFVHFKSQIVKLDETIQKDFKTLEQSISEKGQVMGKCGNCLRYMNFAKIAQVIHCENCKLLLNVNQSNVRCGDHQCHSKRVDDPSKICGFSEVEYKQTYFINDEEKHQIFICVCPSCMQNNQKYFSQERLKIGKCIECGGGSLFLARNKTKKDFFYICSHCPFKLLVLENVERIEIEKDDKCCQKCKLKTLSVKVKAGGFTEKTELAAFCPICDEKRPNPLQDLTNWKLKNKKFGSKKGRKGKFGKPKHNK